MLDWYHLGEHLWEAAGVLHPGDRTGQVRHVAEWKQILRCDGGIRLWPGLEQTPATVENDTFSREAIENLPGNLKPRLAQTYFPAYRHRDLAIGSGAVESAGKQLVVKQAKGAGMYWAAGGLEAVLTLRFISLNRDWDAFWKTDPQRAAAPEFRCQKSVCPYGSAGATGGQHPEPPSQNRAVPGLSVCPESDSEKDE